MKITAKVPPDQIIAVIAQAWGCSVEQVEIYADADADNTIHATLVTDLKGCQRAEKIIDKATKAVEG